MKRILKLIVIMIMIITIPKEVYAHSAAGGGNNNSYGSCDAKTASGKTIDWCFGTIGFRFSLYKYESGNLTYYGSEDYESNKPGMGTLNGRTARIMGASAGKVAYMNSKASRGWSTNYYKLEVKKSTLTCYFDGSCKNFASHAKNEINNYFKLNASPINKANTLKQLKSMFGKSISVTEDDLRYMYVTVEPTMYIYNKSGDSFYGTIYELMYTAKTKGGESLFGLNEILYQTFPNSIIASTPTTTDTNNFVSKDTSKNPKVLVVSSTLPAKVGSVGIDWTSGGDSARKSNRDKIVDKNGYGIAVFWIGKDIKETCKKKCSGKSGNSLLNCAENWCSNTVKTNNTVSKKKNCIVNDCGYKVPDSYSCSTTTSPSSTTTKCDDEVKSSLKTCKTTTYFKTECTETTELTYPNLAKRNSLHVDDVFKTSYSISTSGSKTCTTKFNYKLFEFNYATQVSNEDRKELIDSMNSNTYFSKAVHNTNLKYDVDADAWDTRKFNNSSKNFTLSWKSKSYSEKLSSNTKQYITFFANGKKTTSGSKHYVSKTTVSKNTGVLYNADISYVTSTSGKKTTKTYVKRKTSGLDDTNTCSYKIGENKEELSCTPKILTEAAADGTYFGNVEIEYTINYTVNGAEGDYSDLGFSFKKNDPKTKVTNSVIKRTINIANKDGKITNSRLYLEKTSDTDVSTSCSEEIQAPDTIGGPPEPPSGTTCTLELTPNSYTNKLEVASNKSVYNRPLECEVNFYDGSKKSIIVSGDLEYFNYVGDGEKDLELQQSNPAVSVTCAFDLGDPVKEDCKRTKSIESCNYIKKVNKDLVRDYCNKVEPSNTACFDNCTCPRWPNVDEEVVNEWCRVNWEDEGYASQAICIKDCGPEQIQLSKYIFRPITLGKVDLNYNAFPNREAGSNWTLSEFITEENSFENEKPLYTIILDSEKIKTIKNDGVSKTTGYIPYENATASEKLCFKTDLIKKSEYDGIITVHESGWKGCE